MNTGNGKRQNSTFSPTQTSAGSPPPPGYRPGGVAGDPPRPSPSGPRPLLGAVSRQPPQQPVSQPCWAQSGRPRGPRHRRCRPAPSAASAPGWTGSRSAVPSATWPGTSATAVRAGEKPGTAGGAGRGLGGAWPAVSRLPERKEDTRAGGVTGAVEGRGRTAALPAPGGG